MEYSISLTINTAQTNGVDFSWTMYYRVEAEFSFFFKNTPDSVT
jgi:hypothetical protein